MKLSSIFSSFIYEDTVDVELHSIQDYCYMLRTASDGLVVSNEGGWHSDYLDVNHPALKPLFDSILEKLNTLQLQLGFKNEFVQKYQSAWININKDNQYNKPHTHPGAFFSGCVYIKAERNAGAIELQTPIGAFPYVIPNGIVDSYNFYNSEKWTMNPEAGNLIVFPPWVSHFTQPNHSGFDRISIAFNTELVRK